MTRASEVSLEIQGALHLALPTSGIQAPKEGKGSVPCHLASQPPGMMGPLCDPVPLLSVQLRRSLPSSALGTLEVRKRMEEGSASTLSIVRGSGSLQPSTIVEGKTDAPWL